MMEILWTHVQSLLDLSSDSQDPDAGSAIMMGSIMSRAINGSAPFVPTLVAGAILLLMHWAFAAASFRVHWISATVKGTRDQRHPAPEGRRIGARPEHARTRRIAC